MSKILTLLRCQHTTFFSYASGNGFRVWRPVRCARHSHLGRDHRYSAYQGSTQ